VTRDKFEKVEEYLMGVIYDTGSCIHPGKILKYLKIINSEGTFIFFRRNNRQYGDVVAPGKNSDFLMYP